MRSHSHGAVSPEFCNLVVPLPRRGRRESRAPTAPAAPCAMGSEKTHTDLTGTAETSRLSPRNGFTAYFVLSPVSGVSCHRRRRDIIRRLDATVAAPGPHDFAVRCGVFVRRETPPDAAASIATRAPFRDDREASLMAARAGSIDTANQNSGKANYFRFRGLTALSLICPSCRICNTTLFHLMARSPKDVSNHEAPLSPAAHPSRRALRRAPQDEGAGVSTYDGPSPAETSRLRCGCRRDPPRRRRNI